MTWRSQQDSIQLSYGIVDAIAAAAPDSRIAKSWPDRATAAFRTAGAMARPTAAGDGVGQVLP